MYLICMVLTALPTFFGLRYKVSPLWNSNQRPRDFCSYPLQLRWQVWQRNKLYQSMSTTEVTSRHANFHLIVNRLAISSPTWDNFHVLYPFPSSHVYEMNTHTKHTHTHTHTHKWHRWHTWHMYILLHIT